MLGKTQVWEKGPLADALGSTSEAVDPLSYGDGHRSQNFQDVFNGILLSSGILVSTEQWTLNTQDQLFFVKLDSICQIIVF